MYVQVQVIFHSFGLHEGLFTLTSASSASSESRSHYRRQWPFHCSSPQSIQCISLCHGPTATLGRGSKHCDSTYHWSQEALPALSELLQRILLIVGALYDLGYAGLANVVEDCLDLLNSGRLLGDVELEWVSARLRLRGMVAGLVNSSSGLCIGRDLLD